MHLQHAVFMFVLAKSSRQGMQATTLFVPDNCQLSNKLLLYLHSVNCVPLYKQDFFLLIYEETTRKP
jgi:hypothetical protein